MVVPVLSPCAVKHLDIVEDIGLGFLVCHLDPSLDTLTFQEQEEAFRKCVVVAVAAKAHTAD